jgi:nitrite reductase/ring-hydroxylating ferredoxin subunit
LSETYHRAAPDSEIGENGVIGVILNGWPVALCRADGKLFAVVDKCTHANSELSGGRVRRGSIMCPLHGARFELASGKCIGAPYRPLKTFALRVTDGWIEVAVPDTQPGLEHQPARPLS